ncbi:hypothetical protein L6164_032645 [Bauhinia variegata]|uniref:Uncharacterized protein n=1 Tax=Bauhinia variegata TaxID=167791 RepID=A0ACB9KPP9_BAUVA|nr:hypothetical protein L6164_032645 [Bauhinia variegata]
MSMLVQGNFTISHVWLASNAENSAAIASCHLGSLEASEYECGSDSLMSLFSATGKLSEYASSSLQQVIVKYNLHSGTKRLDHQFIEQQTENDNDNMLRKKVADLTREHRLLNGEELEASTIQELQKLEELLERGLSRVSKEKDERIAKQISELKRRELLIMEENRRLKQLRSTVAHEQGQSSESTIICGSSYPLQDCDSSDISLNLGLSLFK